MKCLKNRKGSYSNLLKGIVLPVRISIAFHNLKVQQYVIY